MDALFPPDRSLLFPQFETFRLHSLDPDEDVLSYPLPGNGATQSRVGYNTHLLSFSEVQSRIEWNHLAIGPSGRGMYVDADWNVIGISLNDSLQPLLSRICEIPAPLTRGNLQQQHEYPSCVELDPDRWAVADGAGTLYVLSVPMTRNQTGSVVSIHQPRPYRSRASSNGGPSSEGLPFLIQGVQRDTAGKARSLLLSFAHPVEKGQRSSTSTTFELGTYATADLLAESSEAGPPTSYFGSDLPVLVDSTGGEQEAWTVLSAKEFAEPQSWDKTRSKEEERKERERLAEGGKAGLGAKEESSIAPQTGEGIGDISSGATIEEVDESQVNDAPYSWTQTDETFSLRIPFRPGTSRDHLDISLTSTDFNLACRDIEAQTPTLRSLLDRRKRKWWGDIDPGESIFTYDFKTGVLDFELIKKDSNIRWPSVFNPGDDDDVDDDPFAEIPETFDSATLAAVRESFGRIKRRDSAEPEGNHPAIPALLREEMDYDLEDGEDYDETGGSFGDTASGHKVGRDVQVGTLERTARWSRSSSTVVSLPLSGNIKDGIIVKSAVDGLLFLPPGNPSSEPWRHISTIPALSFVLSSKRDVRFVRHITNYHGTTVLAFDSGAVPGGGNVYVYYPPIDKTSAKQGVVRISGGERGALLGVGEVDVGGKKAVLALCEKELVVLAGVLRE